MEDRTLPSPIHIHLNSRLLGTNVQEQAVHGMLKPCDRPLTDSLYYTRHPRREPHEKSFCPTTFQHGLTAGGGRSLLFIIKTCFPVEREARTLNKSCGGPFFFLLNGSASTRGTQQRTMYGLNPKFRCQSRRIAGTHESLWQMMRKHKTQNKFRWIQDITTPNTSPANLVLDTRYIWAKLYKAKLQECKKHSNYGNSIPKPILGG